MSEIKTLLKQSSHYFVGRAFLMAAGLISFPILTRVFSVADYGMLGLVSTTLFVVTAIAKLGFPSAIIRFHAEVKAQGRLVNFYSTTFWGSLIVSVVIAILFFISIQLFSYKLFNRDISRLLSLASILICTMCLADILTSFLRAEQRTKLYNLIAIIRRYGSLALSICLVFFFVKGLFGFYVGQIISSIIILCFLIYHFRKQIKTEFAYFSLPLLGQSIKFGFPLVCAEFGHLILSYADRYLIQLYLGSEPLGLYTAGYNLVTYVTEVIIYPINYAMTPIYMKLLVDKGKPQTKQFFTRLFTFFCMIMIPTAFGLTAVGRDLINFLASAKYAKAYIVLPYVVGGQAVYACTIILNSGLFISKKTSVVTYVMLISCVINIALNMVLIPLYGILGAAQATAISYILYAFILTYFSMREFSFSIEYRRIIQYFFASLVMFLVVIHINFTDHLANLFVKVIAGGSVYLFIVLVVDRELRRQSIGLAKSLGNRYPRFFPGF